MVYRIFEATSDEDGKRELWEMMKYEPETIEEAKECIAKEQLIGCEYLVIHVDHIKKFTTRQELKLVIDES